MDNSQTTSKEVIVLILHYGSAEETLRCLSSLEPQRDWIREVVLLDNNSPEALPEDISNRVRLPIVELKSDVNLGFAGGMNRLIDYALSSNREFPFLFLNNDTIAEDGFISSLLDLLDKKRLVAPVIIDEEGNGGQWAGVFDREMIKTVREDHTGLEEGTGVEMIDGSCFLTPPGLFENGVRFDEDLFLYYEDIDLFLRLKSLGYEYWLEPKARLFHVEGGATGGQQQPSKTRNYYFYRNRLAMAQRLHPIPKRWRVYLRLIRLALEQRKKLTEFPEAQGAILKGITHFFLGKMGKGSF